MVADLPVVVMKSRLMRDGAKEQACLDSKFYYTTSNGMIDYFETKSQPITRVMVWQAYKVVRANKGAAGVDSIR